VALVLSGLWFDLHWQLPHHFPCNVQDRHNSSFPRLGTFSVRSPIITPSVGDPESLYHFSMTRLGCRLPPPPPVVALSLEEDEGGLASLGKSGSKPTCQASF
jgi:hypothetical protein